MGLAGPVETTLLGAEWVGRLGSAIRVTNHDQMSHPGDSCEVCTYVHACLWQTATCDGEVFAAASLRGAPTDQW